MRIIDAIWFSSFTGTMGIVVIENETGERKAYIGHAAGLNERDDMQHIADHGAPIYAETLRRIADKIDKAIPTN